MYSKYVFDDKLVSPVNGHSVKSLLTPRSIQKFGFNSYEELNKLYPGFPRRCNNNIVAYNTRVDIKSKIDEESYNLNKSKCLLCDNEFNYYDRDKKFCDLSCSRSYHNLLRNPSTFSDKIILYKNRIKLPTPEISGPYTIVYKNKCRYSGKIFYSDKKESYHRNSIFEDRTAYKNASAFRFKLYDYDIEGLELLSIYGMYHPIKNPNGVSRDHIISIDFGWKNNIDPAIISHPCNCRIISHHDNNAKNTRSDLSLEELIIKIKSLEFRVGLEPT